MAVERCGVLGCGRPKRKRGWCGKHYAMWKRTGDPATAPKWTVAPLGGSCQVCGAPDLMDGSRRYCSHVCQARASRSHRKGDPGVPLTTTCVICGDTIDLLEPGGPAGRKRREDTRQCGLCRKRRHYRHKFPVKVLARRDGPNCQLCDEPIDFTIVYPDPRSPSVDHVIPRAHGGTDDPSNLQAAHLRCNMLKHARMPETMPVQGGKEVRRGH